MKKPGRAQPNEGPFARHVMDLQVDAVRMGWLPFYPQFDISPIELVKRAAQEGATTDEEITHVGGHATEKPKSCGSRSKIRTRLKTGRASGSSGAATPCWQRQGP